MQEPASHVYHQPASSPYPALVSLPQAQSNNLQPPPSLLPPPALTPTPRPRLKRDRTNAGLGLGIGPSTNRSLPSTGALAAIDEMPLSEDEGWSSPNNSRRVYHSRASSLGGDGDTPDEGNEYGNDYFGGSNGGRGPPRRKRIRHNLESMEPAFASLSLAPLSTPSVVLAPIEDATTMQPIMHPQLVPLSHSPPAPPQSLPSTTTTSSQLPVTPPMQQSSTFLSPTKGAVGLSPTPSPQPQTLPTSPFQHQANPPTPTPTIQTSRPTPTSTPEILFSSTMPSFSFDPADDMEMSASNSPEPSTGSFSSTSRRSPSSYEISKDRIIVTSLDDSDDDSPPQPPSSPEVSPAGGTSDMNSMEVKRALGLSDNPNDSLPALLRSMEPRGDLILYRPVKFGVEKAEEDEREARRKRDDFAEYQRKVLEEEKRAEADDEDEWKEIQRRGGAAVEEDVEMDLDG